MTKSHLFRDKAPITEAGWVEIEKEAKRTLRTLLAARRVVDFRGPLGWDDSDVELGRADPIASPTNGRNVEARLRRVQPLVELRMPTIPAPSPRRSPSCTTTASKGPSRWC
jgi:uncharacterized linocin/CFP29 family protein